MSLQLRAGIFYLFSLLIGPGWQFNARIVSIWTPALPHQACNKFASTTRKLVRFGCANGTCRWFCLLVSFCSDPLPPIWYIFLSTHLVPSFWEFMLSLHCHFPPKPTLLLGCSRFSRSLFAIESWNHYSPNFYIYTPWYLIELGRGFDEENKCHTWSCENAFNSSSWYTNIFLLETLFFLFPWVVTQSTSTFRSNPRCRKVRIVFSALFQSFSFYSDSLFK